MLLYCRCIVLSVAEITKELLAKDDKFKNIKVQTVVSAQGYKIKYGICLFLKGTINI